METTIVAMALMNPQNTANQKVEHASVISSHVTMEIAFLAFTYAVSCEPIPLKCQFSI